MVKSVLSRALIAYIFLFTQVHAQDSVPVRDQILNCKTLLSVKDNQGKPNDGIGVPVSKGKAEEFEIALVKMLEEGKRNEILGSIVYVTGIAMGDEPLVQSKYQEVLTRHQFQPDEVKVKIFSAPRSLLKQEIKSISQEISHRIKYFWPSYARDYQTPLKNEVINGIVTDVIVESLDVVYLMKTMPPLEASLVIAAHSGISIFYSVYTKMTTNWLLRKGTSEVELFIKQMIMAAPFVLNYNILGNFSKILTMIQTQGLEGVIGHSPHALREFILSQSMTIFLESVFYVTVVIKGYQAWVNAKGELKESEFARSDSAMLEVPILVPNSLLIAVASAGAYPLCSIAGCVSVDAGHLALVALTVVGYFVTRPPVLERTLKTYRKVNHFLVSWGLHPARWFKSRASYRKAN